MVDYRAMNRNTKGLDAERKRLASKFSNSTPERIKTPTTFSKPAPKATSYNRFATKNGLGNADFIGGKSGPIIEATSLGDFVNRLGRNYTVDIGDATSRIIQDTFLGGKGDSSLIKQGDVSLPEAIINPQGAKFRFVMNNVLNNPDFTQMLAPGDFVGVSRAATLAAKVAKPLIPVASSRAGRIAAASIGAVAASGLTSPDSADAMNPRPIIKEALKNKGILNALFEDLPQEIQKHLNAAASKQNNYTRKTLKNKIGKEINKDEWFDSGVGLAGKDIWDQTTSFFKNNEEFVDEAGQFTESGLDLAEKIFTGSRARSLQVSHIRPLEEARNATKPFIAQGPGKSILTWPRVNRDMGAENMLSWLRRQPEKNIDTTKGILRQLGIIN